MECTMCSSDVLEANHIAIDKNGDPQVLCEECYEKVRIFFEEVKCHGKDESGRSHARGK